MDLSLDRKMCSSRVNFGFETFKLLHYLTQSHGGRWEKMDSCLMRSMPLLINNASSYLHLYYINRQIYGDNTNYWEYNSIYYKDKRY